MKKNRDIIIMQDWTGKFLFKGSYKHQEINNVLNANKCLCYGREKGCQICDHSGYIGDFEVYWAYPELNEDRENVYEYINY